MNPRRHNNGQQHDGGMTMGQFVCIIGLIAVFAFIAIAGNSSQSVMMGNPYATGQPIPYHGGGW